MGVVMSFINEKGGVGKTSCNLNIGWELASNNNKILFIDLDGQRANLTFFLGVQKNERMLTMRDILQSGKDPQNAIINIKENIDIIPGTIDVVDLSPASKIRRMKEVIKELKTIYDYIFIDVNPTPNRSHALTLSVCDFIIIPMMPDVASREANKGILESVEEIQEVYNPSLKVLGIIINKDIPRTDISKGITKSAEKLAEQLGTKVFKTKIRNLVALSETVSSHVGVTEYDPRSKAARDIKSVTKEIEKEIKKYV